MIKAPPPLFSVIIPCRDEKKYIIECIEAVLTQTEIQSINIEILVIDAMSKDGTRELIRSKFGNRIKIIDNPHLFTPFAFNIGIHAAKGSFIVINGARNIISPNYLKTAIKTFDLDTHIACVGGCPVNIYSNELSECISKAMSSRIGVGFSNFRVLSRSQYVDTVGTPVFRREIFDRIGYFDERLVRNQDDDFSYRILKAGYKIYQNVNAYMKYYVRTSFKNLYRQFYQYGFWKIFVNKKHNTITTFRQIIPSIFIAYILVGGILAAWAENISIFYITSLVVYIVVLFLFGFRQYTSIKKMTFFSIAVMIMHMAYGLGYWKGIFNLILLNKDVPEYTKKLSR